MFCEIYKLQVAQDGKALIIKSGTCKPQFYMPLGDIKHGINAVEDYCSRNKIKPVFTKIPYSHTRYFEANGYKISEDRNSFDYIFRNQDLCSYQGKDYRKQRNNLANYLKTFTPAYTEDILEHIDECKAFTIAHYNKNDVLNPTMRILDNIHEFECRGGIVWNNDTIQGFCVYETISGDTVLSHVELTDNSHRGIHAYMINEMSKRIGGEYVNKEDDVGLMGLRKFKESYNPWQMLKKYNAAME